MLGNCTNRTISGSAQRKPLKQLPDFWLKDDPSPKQEIFINIEFKPIPVSTLNNYLIGQLH